MIGERDFVKSLARGFAVLRAFEGRDPVMTLAEVADAADVSRPAARRLLLTLAELGYVRVADGTFALTPRILSLGQVYLASLDLVEVAQPRMRDLAGETNETAALTTLDESEVVFVARVAAERIISSTLVVGSRLPAHATSLGRVLLAHLDSQEQEARLRARPLVRYTEQTVVEIDRLVEILAGVREQGWSAVDQELEAGLRSVAVPIFDQTQTCVAALASSCHASRVSNEQLVSDVLPLVRRVGAEISAALGHDDSANMALSDETATVRP